MGRDNIGQLFEAGRATELADKTMKEVSVMGREIVLAKFGDSYYAADNRCPHMGSRLSKGNHEETVVTCPLHGSQFNLKNGEVVRWLKGAGLQSKIGKVLKSPKPLKSYKVKVEEDRIMIEV